MTTAAGMTRIDTDVLVAGGGVAGLTATAAFAAAGFRALCVDPVPPVTSAEADGSDLRSTAFLMPAVDLLARAGLWERLAPHAAPLRIMRIADAGGAPGIVRTTADFDSAEIGADAFGYNLPNWLLRREMVAALDETPGAELRAGVRVTGLTPRTDAALVTLSDDTQVRARLVVAADGRDSAVREAVGIGTRRWGYGQKAVVFTVAHAMPHQGVSIEIHRTGGPFTLVPLPDRDGEPASSVVWMDTGPRATALAGLAEAEFNASLAARSCGVLGAIRVTSPRRVWPIITQIADRLDGPRTALVAEAAHVVPPIGAQGLNMSLADLATLLELAATADDIGAPDLLDRYNRQRHRDIRLRIAGIDALNRAAMAEARPLRDLRRLGLATLHGLPPLRHVAMRLGLGALRPRGHADRH
ncbi:2-octaprenyl-6-methoxyphenol hydroxylase [Amaricoccus macauensis]|uniref:2-octaprenyl-6-methoxyphenol hydroxylase n=2 Tax=Amaricoccus macauensis TaxID=57001 RepID=A0A840SPV1_9RHOB|nr:2-octaprenyl-6-methoxyphenol hydroxylase [Amaricoccus macauensis]